MLAWALLSLALFSPVVSVLVFSPHLTRDSDLLSPWKWVHSEYADSVVRVNSRNEGSGVVIYKDGDYGLVLTCSHVIAADFAFAIFARGEVSAGPILVDNPTHDVAIFACRVPDYVEAVPIASESPKIGCCATLIGFGGPGGRRVFEGSVSQSEPFLEVEGFVLPGDSGGAVICNGQLIGLIAGGSHADMVWGQDNEPWQMISPVQGPSAMLIREDLENIPWLGQPWPQNVEPIWVPHIDSDG